MANASRRLQFCVIADDLTGAMDTGVGLTQAGLSAVITFSNQSRVSSDAMVATTDSRAESAREAYRRVKLVAERFRSYYIYKKIDSTLRGNVAAELQALLDVTRASHAVVCPAFPASKRTVVDGNLLVDGVPVHQTSLSRDPVSPVKHSDIAALLRTGSGIPAQKIGLDEVERGPGPLSSRIRESESRAVVIDATEDRHLRCIADALALLGSSCLPCGSGGLGAQIPLAFGYSYQGRKVPPAPDGPALLAIGSRNDVSIRQVQRVIDLAGPPLVRIEPREFRTRAGREPRINQIAGEILTLLEKHPAALVTSSLSDYATQLRRTMAPILGSIVLRVLDRGKLAGLFLSGGDVARAVCGDDGIQGLRILGDLQPGVIVGEVIGTNHEGLRVITKAGGFGDEDAMVQALHHLTQGDH